MDKQNFFKGFVEGKHFVLFDSTRSMDDYLPSLNVTIIDIFTIRIDETFGLFIRRA